MSQSSTRDSGFSNSQDLEPGNQSSQPPARKRVKQGRPPDPLADMILIPKYSDSDPNFFRLSDAQMRVQKCRYCSYEQAHRDAQRIREHAAYKCSNIPEEVRVRALSTLATGAPSELAVVAEGNSGIRYSDTSDFKQSDTSRRPHCTTCTCFLDNYHGKQKQSTGAAIDFAIMLFIIVCGIPLKILDNPFFKNMFFILRPTYQPPSSTRFTVDLLPREAARVEERTMAILQRTPHLTSSFDGLTTPHSGESIYTHHATTPNGESYLIAGHHHSKTSHTAAFLHSLLTKDMERIGPIQFSGQVSDNTGNTRSCRQLTATTYPWLINMFDSLHHLNLLAKDLGGIPLVQRGYKLAARVTTHFSHATLNATHLEEALKERGIKRGLETMGKTRFSTAYKCARSVQRCLPGLYHIIRNKIIDVKAVLTTKSYDPTTATETTEKINLAQFFEDSPTGFEFKASLDFAVSVLQPIALSLTVLEGVNSTPADVFLQWIILAYIFYERFEKPGTPYTAEYPSTCRQIITKFNSRFRECIDKAPTKVYRDAFFLHPYYHNSMILKNDKSHHDDIAQSLTKIFLTTVNLRGQFPDHPSYERFRNQLASYAYFQKPYDIIYDMNDGPLAWWKRLLHMRGVEVEELATVAIKIFSLKTTSMPEERCASIVTWLMPGRRGSMKPATLLQIIRCREYYLQSREGLNHFKHLSLQFENVKSEVIPNTFSTPTESEPFLHRYQEPRTAIEVSKYIYLNINEIKN